SVSQFRSEADAYAATILSRAFQTLSKILTVRIVYESQPAYLPEAKAAFKRVMKLDEGFEPVQLGYDLRWQAVLMSAEKGTLLRVIDDTLLASRERVPRGSLAEVSIVREYGVVRWRKSHLKKAQEFLSDAADGFTAFADQRALGSTFA